MDASEAVAQSQAVAQLRRNDPNVYFVRINLGLEQDFALAQALERNEYVNTIVFQYLMPRTEQEQQQQQQRWDNLLRVLATREKLKTVEFIEGMTVVEHALIEAVQQNAFLRSMRFSGCNLASGELVSSFLDTATSLTKFDLYSCEMTTQGAERIAASLQRHSNLQTLSLSGLEDSHLTRILQGLETNTCLQSLNLLYGTLGQAVSFLALQHLLESTSSIRCLQLNHHAFEESVRPICQGLIHSTAVSRVQFKSCQFYTQASADLFRQMIDTKPNLQLLSIHQCSFPGNLIALLGATISAALLRPNSLLRTFELIQGDLNSFFPGPAFGALLSAVGRSSLVRFSIGDLHTDLQFQTLLNSLPAIKITELEFHLVGVAIRVGADRKQLILQAAKRNFSLRSMKASLPSFVGRALFTDDEENSLQFYFDRNERLAQWVANPASVPRLLWPEALGLALEAGEDSLYRSLQAVLGDEVESALGQRKRKRQANKDKRNCSLLPSLCAMLLSAAAANLQSNYNHQLSIIL